ncbi:hypothetical protein HII12_004283 [Brettanomyces bruxellensis]|uniref:Uncharacterized protein n=1 Tax=Dekkera bruxellensis TaxID=5007 RepID=A0A8H6BA80_DEKBR|nr:hypothetical protein HII12_004283 [Brettanomyces bruxellensis]
MGLCGSKESENREAITKVTGRRLGEGNRKVGNDIKYTKQAHAKVNNRIKPIKGERLGGSSKDSNEDKEHPDNNNNSAKSMAAQAAARRMQEKKTRNEKGTLGKKLAEQNHKKAKDIALEEYNQKISRQNEILYD